MIVSLLIEEIIGSHQLAKRSMECWIARGGRFQEIDCLSQSSVDRSSCAWEQQQSLGLAVLLECDHVSGGTLLNSVLFRGRKFGLKLIGDGFGDLALDGKDIVNRPVVVLRPLVPVIARID